MTQRHYRALMWAEACDLLARTERLHRQFFRPDKHATWEPPIDLIQNGAQLQIIIALPGVRPEQLRVQLKTEGLFVEATRSHNLNIHCATIHRLEIPYGRFVRHIALPPGTYSLKEQLFRDGCLSLQLIKHDREFT